MKKIFTASALAIAALSVSPIVAVPAAAQAKAVAVADLRAAAARSNAFTVASQQIQTTYKAQIDQQETRGQTLQAELNVLVAKYNEEAKKTPQNQAALQAAAKAVQDKRQAATAELQRISAPIDLAVAYVEDQISVRMNEAIKAAMTAKKVDLLVNPEAVLARENNVDITDAVVAEINRLLPNVSITVPAGYQPGQLVQQRNQQLMDAARNAQPGAAPAAPTGSAPTTR
ncbi:MULTISPECIES: OmpH family outer membrane protein [unclassified Sphingopyxis]|jgi:Skp family chaperone for outer membrane proteins|uniref:OmpH family outer membrane protein n=1 Tax=unclassified Sphingopyxis TaxID=2614943 RepID=UPI000730FF17|nr:MULTISPECIES: OmpH family outer membrane protein [unclassified Sphingopyxis]KTE23928.1 outer membrane chaperone Skp [Sphingopyxis sp. H057]KTE51081.1 outer membrane chaperone Skp [Sphingopyxis sp. H073]KTE51293.1 outer membrane chaperone Skp [Sphingopyxis sp. H071]KTE58801.1 outer membrane chaperone Skp [Sphingopyxis sp. H107]KTE63359.1 outer membrane chaperone Skp [Sphingopyxis sp. H100]